MTAHLLTNVVQHLTTHPVKYLALRMNEARPSLLSVYGGAQGGRLLGPPPSPKPLRGQSVEPASRPWAPPPPEARGSPPPRPPTSHSPRPGAPGSRAAPRTWSLQVLRLPSAHLPKASGQMPLTFPEEPSALTSWRPTQRTMETTPTAPFLGGADACRGGWPACPNNPPRDWRPPDASAHAHWFTVTSRLGNQ